MGITEEDEEEAELDAEFEDEDVEEVDQFGPELGAASRIQLHQVGPVMEVGEDVPEPVTPVSVVPAEDLASGTVSPRTVPLQPNGTTPLTAAALAKMEEHQEHQEAEDELVKLPVATK